MPGVGSSWRCSASTWRPPQCRRRVPAQAGQGLLKDAAEAVDDCWRFRADARHKDWLRRSATACAVWAFVRTRRITRGKASVIRRNILAAALRRRARILPMWAKSLRVFRHLQPTYEAACTGPDSAAHSACGAIACRRGLSCASGPGWECDSARKLGMQACSEDCCRGVVPARGFAVACGRRQYGVHANSIDKDS